MSATPSNKIARRPFVAELLARREGALIVCGLGSPTWDSFAAGDSPEYLYSWGGMGLAVPTALGVALAQPARRVVCVTGDGEMLMGIGSLGVVADQAPANLGILVLDNESFGETGRQRGLTSGRTDIAAVASGLRHRQDAHRDGAGRSGRAGRAPVQDARAGACRRQDRAYRGPVGAAREGRRRHRLEVPGRPWGRQVVGCRGQTPRVTIAI